MLMKTKEVLEKTGISRQVLYRYITAGLIQEEQKTSTRRRLFSPAVIDKIKLIQQINKSGYTLREIGEIFFRNK